MLPQYDIASLMAADYEHVRSTAVNALWSIIEQLQGWKKESDLTPREWEILRIATKAHQTIAETYTLGE